MSNIGTPEHYIEVFETIMSAADDGNLALVKCKDITTGKDAYVIVVTIDEDDGSCDMVPVARLFDGNPYEQLDPPEGTDVKPTH